MHTNLCDKVMQEVKGRAIDELNSFEEELMSGALSSSGKADLLKYLERRKESDDEKRDLKRLICILILTSEDKALMTQCLELCAHVLQPSEMSTLQSLMQQAL
jgi:hypothetical protein